MEWEKMGLHLPTDKKNLDMLLEISKENKLDTSEIERAIEKRNNNVGYTPTLLKESEKWTEKGIKEYNKKNPDFASNQDIKKQYGELYQHWGALISRIETILNKSAKGILQKNVSVDSETDRERYIIKSTFKEFTKGFTLTEKRNLIKYQEAFSIHRFYGKIKITGKDGKIIEKYGFKDLELITILFEGEISDVTEKRYKNLEIQNKNMKRKEFYTGITIKINKKLFEAIDTFYKNKFNRKQKLPEIIFKEKRGDITETFELTKGVTETLLDMTMEVRDAFNSLKFWLLASIEGGIKGDPDGLKPERCKACFDNPPESVLKILPSFNYNDKHRLALTELISHEARGRQNRKKNSIDFRDDTYNSLFPSKHAGDFIRFKFIILVYNGILKDRGLGLRLEVKWQGKQKKRGLIGIVNQ